MLFPTLTFAIFFVIVFCIHCLLKSRPTAWKIFMLTACYVFYGWWAWRFLSLLVAYTVVNWAAALGVEHSSRPAIRRLFLAGALFFDLGMLVFFKYFGFFAISIYQGLTLLHIPCPLVVVEVALPIGISFFTFQAMSYMIDVYRKELPAATSLLDFALFKAFFPQLVAGPIVRAHDLLPQITNYASRGPLNIGRAVCLIAGGLFKKMVIANSLATIIVDPVFANPATFGGLDILLAVYGYAFQIYCDFSAYSDIAIGIGLILGIELPINFNAPYLSTSLHEFWQRWHISLSTWLRDYLYFPLGGSRGGEALAYRNLFITFLLGGLWHGANWTFIFWGFLHGIYRGTERLVSAIVDKASGGRALITNPLALKLWQLAKGIWLFHFVCLSWLFFRAQSFSDALIAIRQLFCWTTPRSPAIIVVVIIMGFLSQYLDGDRMRPLWRKFEMLNPIAQGLLAAAVILLIIAMGPEGVAPFIYFQF